PLVTELMKRSFWSGGNLRRLNAAVGSCMRAPWQGAQLTAKISAPSLMRSGGNVSSARTHEIARRQRNAIDNATRIIRLVLWRCRRVGNGGTALHCRQN